MMPFCAVELKHAWQNINIFQCLFTITTSGRCAAGSTNFRFVWFGFCFGEVFHLYSETKMSLERDIFDAPFRGAGSSRVAAPRFHRCRTQGPEPKHLMGYTTATPSLALPSLVQQSLLYSWVNRFFFRLGQVKTVHLHFECRNLTLLPKAGKYFCT